MITALLICCNESVLSEMQERRSEMIDFCQLLGGGDRKRKSGWKLVSYNVAKVRGK